MNYLSLSFFVRCLILMIVSASSMPLNAQIPGLGGTGEEAIVNINEVSKEEADHYVAGLSDTQARELLLKQIDNRPPRVAEMSVMGETYISYAIMSLHHRSALFETELKKIADARQHYSESLKRVMHTLFYAQGESTLLKVTLTLILLLAAGSVAVTLAFRPLHTFRESIRQKGDYPAYLRLGRAMISITHDLLKIGLFTLVTVPLTFVFFDQDDPARILASSTLILVAASWAIRDVLKELLFSPVCKDMFIKGERSRTIYFWSLLIFFTTFIFALLISALLGLLEFPSELVRLNILIIVTISFLALIIGTFLIAHAKTKHSDGSSDVLRIAVSNNKYWLIVLVLLVFYTISFENIVIGANLSEGQSIRPGYNYYALLMFIFMPMYLRVVKLLMIVQPIKELLPDNEPVSSESHTLDSNLKSNKWVRLVFTIPYAILIVLFALEGTKIGLLSWFSEGAGSEFGEAATGVLVACMLGVIAWNFVNSFINKNLPKVALDPKSLMNGEGSGSDAATRTQTVLPIVRNFALVLIVIMVLFSVMSSLGINTAPLLAGAGVMGLAIGFGAQKLVQDVVSGMFFLFEDAFRIGEYIVPVAWLEPWSQPQCAQLSYDTTWAQCKRFLMVKFVRLKTSAVTLSS